jgi:hypothetical protein
MDAYLYRALAIRAALKLWQKGIKVNRAFTLKKALSICTGYTGRSYNRNMIGDAIDDMTVFIERTKSSPMYRS